MKFFKYSKAQFLSTLVILGIANHSNANHCGEFYTKKVTFKASKEAPLILENGLLRLPENFKSSDPYEVLGVSKDEKETEDAFDQRLKKRARKLYMTYHSDRAEHILISMFENESKKNQYIDDAKVLLDTAFIKIKNAFECIKNSDLRSNYRVDYQSNGTRSQSVGPFDGYFENSEIDTGNAIIELELNDRIYTMQNIQPIIDVYRKGRTWGLFNREQRLNNSYRIGSLKAAITKARRYIKKKYPEEFNEETYRKSIEYFIVNHLVIFRHKFSFKDFIDVYKFGQHPKIKYMIAINALLEADNHYQGKEKTEVKYSILSHLISDLHNNNSGFFRSLDGDKLMKYVVFQHSDLKLALADFIKIWLKDIPAFLDSFPDSKNDNSMFAFFDLMDLERSDLPIQYLEDVAKGMMPTRARALARELLKWEDILALTSI